MDILSTPFFVLVPITFSLTIHIFDVTQSFLLPLPFRIHYLNEIDTLDPSVYLNIGLSHGGTDVGEVVLEEAWVQPTVLRIQLRK